jgi:hypothetical protein
MTMRTKWVAVWLAPFLCFVAGPSYGQLKGENLLVNMPTGFKVGYQDSRNGVKLVEWIPVNETVQNWSEMVTVQIFFKRSDLDPTLFLRKIEEQWLAACKGSTPVPTVTGKANGYDVSMVLLRCPLLPSTGKPETTMFRAIRGSDSFYLVQRAVRSVASPEQLERIKQYLGSATVCDAGASAHPCPALQGPVAR